MKDPETRDKYVDEPLELVKDQVKREKHEPTELQSPISVGLVFAFFALCFWAGAYFIKYSGNMNPYVYDESISTLQSQDTLTSDASVEKSIFDIGKQLYNQNCMACHQSEGQGLAGVFPPLAESEWVIKNETPLIAILLKGLSGEITVKGATYNGNMPAFDHWDDDKIAAVLTYIRTNADWGNQASEISVESVAKSRKQFADRTEPWSAADLSSFFEETP